MSAVADHAFHDAGFVENGRYPNRSAGIRETLHERIDSHTEEINDQNNE